MSLSGLSSVEKQRIARDQRSGPLHAPVGSAEKLLQLLQDEVSAARLSEHAWRKLRPLLNKLGARSMKVDDVKASDRAGQFQVGASFLKTDARRGPSIRLEFTIENPRYDCFRGDLRYAIIAAAVPSNSTTGRI